MERPFRYRPVPFFLITYVATWIPWLIGIKLAGASPEQQGQPPLLGYLGLLGPLVVSLAFIFTSGSRALKADFRSRFNPGRLKPRYAILAFGFPAAVMYLSIGLSVAFGRSADQFRFSEDANLVSMIVIAMIAAPIIEEISWRGYGVDSLRARLGTLPSTLLFGGLWSLWHAPLVRLPGTYQHEVAAMDNPLFVVNFFVSAVPAAIIANWLYYRTNRSILVGVFFHAAANASAELLSADQVTKCIATVVWGAFAVALIVLDRTTFGGGPRNFVTEPS